ncbi:hypothetical protein CMO83_01040 [Candidatus Woesearchaeota archaeon]|jgi:hypothetical protein|nr:hypothetical protein [Candidatus Woesearchaeota archaeon]MDP6648451.1 hypothetical protein [Candidatus Woesearchaeota archaeon]|tara:strand:- start:41820 stop:42053 length:234 start_codon:yes stop_codon:yes gene_type:complete
MVKVIGLLLISVSLVLLVAGVFVDINYGSKVQITGNVVSNIINQPDVPLNAPYYAQATLFSFSIVAMIMGVMFLFRV